MERLREFVLIFLILVLTLVSVHANCNAGSVYTGINANRYANIQSNQWYLNTQMPCSCSGQVTQYYVAYYNQYSSGTNYQVYMAIWEPTGDGVSYRLINSSIQSLSVTPTGSSSGSQNSICCNTNVQTTNLYVRKDTVIGIYYADGIAYLPIIGQISMGNYHVCAYVALMSSSTVDCTNNVDNILIHAQAEIRLITCQETSIPNYDSSTYMLLDNDTEYGARVQYTCSTGYFMNGGDNIFVCGSNGTWEGIETCEPVTCDAISTLNNGVVNGNSFTYLSIIEFTCQEGYELQGSNAIECTSTGQWNDSVPTCNSTSQQSVGMSTASTSSSLSVSIGPMTSLSISSSSVSESSIDSPTSSIGVSSMSSSVSEPITSSIAISSSSSSLSEPIGSITSSLSISSIGSSLSEPINSITSSSIAISSSKSIGSITSSLGVSSMSSSLSVPISSISSSIARSSSSSSLSEPIDSSTSSSVAISSMSSSISEPIDSVTSTSTGSSGEPHSSRSATSEMSTANTRSTQNQSTSLSKSSTLTSTSDIRSVSDTTTKMSMSTRSTRNQSIKSTPDIRDVSDTTTKMSMSTRSTSLSKSSTLTSTPDIRGVSDQNSGLQVTVSVLVIMMVIMVSIIVAIFVVIFIKKRQKKKRRSMLLLSDGSYSDPTYQTPAAVIGINSAQEKGERSLANPIYGIEEKLIDDSKTATMSEAIYEPTGDELFNGSPPPYPSEGNYFDLDPIIANPEGRQHSTSSAPLHSVANVLYETLEPQELSSQDQPQIYRNLDFDESEVEKPSDDQKQETTYDSLLQSSEYSELKASDGDFIEEPIYWQPETDTQKIYEQFEKKKYTEIPRNHIKIDEHLGSGQFGTVDKGVWNSSKGPVEVAIKTLKGLATEEEEVKFLQEAAINGQFHHPNVVELCGVVTVGQPTLIVLEYVPNGDLKAFLELKRPSPGELVDDCLPEMLIKFSHQVASGMLYLSKKRFIHRDLAARNILVGNNNICKIADFGMSRDLQDEAYYRSNTKRIPVKWTAPEAIYYRKYSVQSDVWSFGALLYEIWSVGHKPFEQCNNQECIDLVDSGYRLPAPPGCPQLVYELMIMCWNPDASARPSFKHLKSELSKGDLVSAALDDQLKARLGKFSGIENDSLYPDLQNKYK